MIFFYSPWFAIFFFAGMLCGDLRRMLADSLSRWHEAHKDRKSLRRGLQRM